MKIIIIIVVSFVQSVICIGQHVFVEKMSKGDRASLAVVIKNGETSTRYFADCFFRDITLLPDTIKVQLIKKLFEYLDDTTMCSRPIRHLSNDYTTVKREPRSKNYNLQIDALILINYIAFSSKAFNYSPYPLLYNKKTKTEISHHGKELQVVINMYRKWFIKIRRKGLQNYSYPISGNKYEWFGRVTKQQEFKSYPQWNSFYNCKEID